MHSQRIGERHSIALPANWTWLERGDDAAPRRGLMRRGTASSPIQRNEDVVVVDMSSTGAGVEATDGHLVGRVARLTIGDHAIEVRIRNRRPGPRPGTSLYGVEFVDDRAVPAMLEDVLGATRPPDLEQYWNRGD